MTNAADRLTFTWTPLSDPDLGEFRAMLISLPQGLFVHKILARYKRELEPVDPRDLGLDLFNSSYSDEDTDEENFLIRPQFYPALDVIIRNQRVRVLGGFRGEEAPEMPEWVEKLREMEAHASEAANGRPAEDSPHASMSKWALADEVSPLMTFMDCSPRPVDRKEEAEDKLRQYIIKLQHLLSRDVEAIDALAGGKLLSVTEATSHLSVGRNTVLNWINAGRLPATRVGSKWMVNSLDLANLRESSAEMLRKNDAAAKDAGKKEETE